MSQWIKRFFLAVLIGANGLFPANAGREDFRDRSIHGKAVEVDTGFPYYQDRSVDSIASEVALNGFECVHLVLLDERTGNRELIDAFHRWGLAVVYMPFISGVYQEADLFPPDADRWKMEFLKSESPYRFYSFVHRDFAEWTRDRLNRVLAQYPFDGITFPETHYPIPLDTFERKPGEVDYVDVSPAFQKAFREATGNAAFPDFNDPNSPHYYKTDTKLYRDLVEFRTRTIVDFFDLIVNGEHGLRMTHPNVSIGLWTIGISTPGFAETLMELEGDDPVRMATRVRPDVYFIQTHWPDWVRGDLPPDYVHSYIPFLEAVKKAIPDLPVGIQFDVGSQYQMMKTPQWYAETCAEAQQAGFDTSTYYEFGLRGAVYFDPPTLKRVERKAPQSLILYFDQRIDPESAKAIPGRQISDFLASQSYTIQSATADGNILTLGVDRPVSGDNDLSFPLGGLSDDPSVRFGCSSTQECRRNAIPENVYLFMSIGGDKE
jgi:hypothetical protein